MPKKIEINIGDKYGKRTVINNLGKDKRGNFIYEYICECESISKVCGSNLIRNKSTQCIKCAGMQKRVIINNGAKYGKMTVIQALGSHNGKCIYKCMCECGRITTKIGSELRSGKSSNCKVCPRIKHGMANTRIYYIWKGAINRCESRQNSDFVNYGARGIKFYQQWKDIHLFIKDVGLPPSKDHTLDRIDVDGNYEPNNVRWATKKEQNSNRRNSPKYKGRYLVLIRSLIPPKLVKQLEALQKQEDKKQEIKTEGQLSLI